MELIDIGSIRWAIFAQLQKGRDYTFEKIVAILYANDLDVDTYRVALALQKGLNEGQFYALNVEDEGAVLFGLS